MACPASTCVAKRTAPCPLYGHPAYADAQGARMARLYQHLVTVGDSFHHWLPTVFDPEPRADLCARK